MKISNNLGWSPYPRNVPRGPYQWLRIIFVIRPKLGVINKIIRSHWYGPLNRFLGLGLGAYVRSEKRCLRGGGCWEPGGAGKLRTPMCKLGQGLWMRTKRGWRRYRRCGPLSQPTRARSWPPTGSRPFGAELASKASNRPPGSLSLPRLLPPSSSSLLLSFIFDHSSSSLILASHAACPGGPAQGVPWGARGIPRGIP